jgi:hypothetical protein
MIQSQAAREAFLCEKTRVVQQQLVNFAGREVHAKNSKFQVPNAKKTSRTKLQPWLGPRGGCLRLGVSLGLEG